LPCAGSRAKAEQSYGSFAAVPVIFGSGSLPPDSCYPDRVGVDRASDGDEFDYVDAALAALILDDE
jgi:hypothetical protein